MGLDLNPLDWPADLLQFAASSPPVEDLTSFALQHLLGFDPPESLIRLALMLGGDVWSAAQSAVSLWWRLENNGLNPWQLLGQVLDDIASFGPGGVIREKIREFWRPIWQAMDELEQPARNIEAFTYAVQDALNREVQAMLQGQQARATDQVSVDNARMQAALVELAHRATGNRQANDVLRAALYTYVPDAAGLIANGVDLFELIPIVAVLIALAAGTAGIGDVIAIPDALAAILMEDLQIYEAGIAAGYDAVAVWLVAQSLDLNPVPNQIAQVAANPPPTWIPAALVQDEKTLLEHQCPVANIRSFMSNPQIQSGYIHDIVQFHPDQACIILTSIDIILKQGNAIDLGGLVATEDHLRVRSAQFTGAVFHIQWMAHHAGQISGIEVPVETGDRPDVLIQGNTVVDCKSELKISDPADQIVDYTASFPGQPIEYVYNGDKLIQNGDNVRSNKEMILKLARGELVAKESKNRGKKAPPVTVDVVFSQAKADNPDGEAFIEQIKQWQAEGLPVQYEIWSSLISV